MRKSHLEEPPVQLPAATAAVREEWLRRAEAEYHSCASAHHLTLWLIQLGASPDLISTGLAVAADELHHAQQSHAVLRAAGGVHGPNLQRERLQLFRDEAA